ncbi:MAG: hypothetical protein FD134_2219 [Gallionellaceae bacterium]|nr:MAG: hypothetical protein FD134_2219 [Gallionellaceae bacterium]
MIAFTDLTGLAGSAVAVAATTACLPGVARLRKERRIILMCAVAVVALFPFGALPLAAYLRGAIGDLSITSLVLLALAIARFVLAPAPAGEPIISCREPECEKDRQALLLLVVLAAAWLYPMALGVGLFDPYRAGYGSVWLVGALLLLALAACHRGRLLVASCIALPVLAWSVGWHESNNLWDYLLDPLLAIYAAGTVVKRGARRRIKHAPAST